jgi:nucleoside phosphorylase
MLTMPHPFFDALSFPWHHPDAVPAQQALLAAYPQFDSIEMLYKRCAAGLPPLSMQGRPDKLWKDALEALTAARALHRLCEFVLADGAAMAAHRAIQRLVDATGSAADPPLRRPGKRPATPPKVDIGILTIRDDEQRAVIDVFSNRAGTVQGAHREYTLRHADAGGGARYTVAVVRQVEQGTGEAQTVARDLIDDLAPRLILVVGIAGGLPSDDVTLGDVVLSTRIHDYTVEARKTGHEATYAATGGPIDRALANAVAELANREDELGDWTSSLPARPPVTWTEDGQLYGPPEWQRELRAKLEHHYPKGATSRAPRYMAGPIASSDRLVKDPAVLIPWLQTARNLLAVEMESGGVYRAVRERCPMLAIRGLSDLVGLSRGDPWTKYACASAAAFTRAFLRTRPVPLGVTAAGPR